MSPKRILANIELILSGAGLVVILAAPVLLGSEPAARWQVAAITATVVGTIHGLIFWLIRCRQRAVRRTIIAELRAMLRDRVNNQLQVISLHLDMHAPRPARDAAIEGDVATIRASLQRISALLNDLSDESLLRWRARYPGAEPPADREVW